MKGQGKQSDIGVERKEPSLGQAGKAGAIDAKAALKEGEEKAKTMAEELKSKSMHKVEGLTGAQKEAGQLKQLREEGKGAAWYMTEGKLRSNKDQGDLILDWSDEFRAASKGWRSSELPRSETYFREKFPRTFSRCMLIGGGVLGQALTMKSEYYIRQREMLGRGLKSELAPLQRFKNTFAAKRSLFKWDGKRLELKKGQGYLASDAYKGKGVRSRSKQLWKSAARKPWQKAGPTLVDKMAEKLRGAKEYIAGTREQPGLLGKAKAFAGEAATKIGSAFGVSHEEEARTRAAGEKGRPAEGKEKARRETAA